MNETMLESIITIRVRQSASAGINPDVLRDGICQRYGNVEQEEFDRVVASMETVKLVGLNLYDSHYVCSCGRAKNNPDRFYCEGCTEDWHNALRFDA